MPEPPQGPTVDEQIQGLLIELQIIAFAAAKEIARLRKLEHGTMPCPMCGQDLAFTICRSNGHMAAACSRSGCINARE